MTTCLRWAKAPSTCSTAAIGLPVASMTMSTSGCSAILRQSSTMGVLSTSSAGQPTRFRFCFAFDGDKSAMATRRMPGVRGTCARYIAANLPAPMSPTRSGLSFLCSSLAYRFISRGFQLALKLFRRRAVLPGQRHVVMLQQAIIGQGPDRREVAVRDVAGPLEATDVVGHRAEREIDAHAVPRREVGGRRMDQAAVKQDHRAARSLGSDDAAALDQLGDRFV